MGQRLMTVNVGTKREKETRTTKETWRRIEKRERAELGLT